MEQDGPAQLVRQRGGVRKGKIRRAVMCRRPGDPKPTKLRDHMGQAYSYRHELEDGHRPWALRPLGHRIRHDQSFEYNLAPAETRPIFLRVMLDASWRRRDSAPEPAKRVWYSRRYRWPSPTQYARPLRKRRPL